MIERRIGCVTRRARGRRPGVVGLRARVRRAAATALLASFVGAAAVPASARASHPSAPELEFSGADLGITLAGAALVGTGRVLLRPRMVSVPPEGLDPRGIRFGLDRATLGPPDETAARISDWTRLAAVVYPPVFTALAAHEHHGGDAAFRNIRVQAEAALLTAGLTFVVKRLASRPRPYAYRPESERAGRPGYDVRRVETFESFPSGHSSAAWAGAMAGLTFLITERPGLDESTHFSNGVLAGGLAASSALLRVQAGKHFPTDVLAGAVVGSAAGVTVALIHQNGDTKGSRGDAWRAGLLGVGTGVLFALLFSPPTSPWAD